MDKREYDQPEPPEERRGRAGIFLLLGIVVVVLMYLITVEGYMH